MTLVDTPVDSLIPCDETRWPWVTDWLTWYLFLRTCSGQLKSGFVNFYLGSRKKLVLRVISGFLYFLTWPTDACFEFYLMKLLNLILHGGEGGHNALPIRNSSYFWYFFVEIVLIFLTSCFGLPSHLKKRIRAFHLLDYCWWLFKKFFYEVWYSDKKCFLNKYCAK